MVRGAWSMANPCPCSLPHAPCFSFNPYMLMQPYRIDYQPQLIEEAVLLAMRGHEDERLFRRERDQIYERFEAEAREAAFQQVHRSWFEILKLQQPLVECFETWPILREASSRCMVMKARAPKEAGAELYRDSAHANAEQIILIQITPALLTQPSASLAFLRHELLHVVDMLDPHFTYVPDLPKSNAGPAHDQLLQNRYAVLWDIIIDGRLHQRGWLPSSAREKHFANFKRAFLGEEEKLAHSFANFFDHNSHTHYELLAFAQHSERWLQANAVSTASSSSRCALCHFPTFHLLSAEELREEVKREIQTFFPAWHESQPICRQCVDLYEARLV